MFGGDKDNVVDATGDVHISGPKRLAVNVTIDGTGEELTEGGRVHKGRSQTILLDVLARPRDVVVMGIHTGQVSNGGRCGRAD